MEKRSGFTRFKPKNTAINSEYRASLWGCIVTIDSEADCIWTSTQHGPQANFPKVSFR
jgi:hypothetical protein